MKKKTYLELLLLIVITFSLTACSIDEDNDPYYNTTERLCSNTWVETYLTSDNLYCTHRLSFAYNGAGQELFIYNNIDINGNPLNTVVKKLTYNFNWSWFNSNNECLVLDYGKNDILYFENVLVRNDYLSGKLEGNNVTFMNDNM